MAENPGRAYNPLFIYGNSGLGKTHLLLAIGQRIHDHNPESRIVYVSGDDFTNDMVHSIRNGTMDEFRNKYRNVDLLLVDDIQFIAGKQSTQEEFFNTFNNIYNDGHQIVITADRPPMEMSLLDDRLRTRFEGGLMADVQPPDLETRTAIIRNKAAQLGMSLPDDVVTFIAENITSNVRQIEGVVKRLTAYREIMDDGITINSVKRAIKDVIRVGAYIPTPDVIIEETARYFSITSSDIRGQRRSKNVAKARQVSHVPHPQPHEPLACGHRQPVRGPQPLHRAHLHPQDRGAHKNRPGDLRHRAGHLLQYKLPLLKLCTGRGSKCVKSMFKAV